MFVLKKFMQIHTIQKRIELQLVILKTIKYKLLAVLQLQQV